MRVIPVRPLGVHHRLHVGSAARVIDLAVARHVFDERLPRPAHFRPVHVLRPDDVVVATKKGARLFPRHDEEILVGRAPRGLEVVLLIGETQRTGIVCVQLEMEVAQADDVQAQRLHRREILKRRVERSRSPLAPGEVEMEVIDERLVPSERLEGIAVREGQHALARRLTRVRAHVEIHAHLLLGSGRRVVQREILHVLRIFFPLRHADAEGESPLGVLAVPHVAEVRVLLAREEERMRRRKHCERAAVRFGDHEAVLRLHARERRIDHAAELVHLKMAAGVAPCDPRREVGREALQSCVVLIRNPLFAGLRRRVHPHEVGALVHSELKVAGEYPHR